jgi:hypothetical protein
MKGQILALLIAQFADELAGFYALPLSVGQLEVEVICDGEVTAMLLMCCIGLLPLPRT